MLGLMMEKLVLLLHKNKTPISSSYVLIVQNVNARAL